jgi:hypothetical protein
MPHRARWTNRALWTVQVLLATLFLFAGIVKLRMPTDVLTQVSNLPGAFLKFIAVAEVLGALGLILPGLLRVRPRLTAVAAVGLVTIMSGATTLSALNGPIAGALVPLITGILAATVAVFRRQWTPAPRRTPRRRTASTAATFAMERA